MRYARNVLLAGWALCAAASARAGLYGDTPDGKHAWAVHDRNRPNPVKIETPPGRPPSDALVLFDGTEASMMRNWKSWGKPWKCAEGAFWPVAGSGSIDSKQAFGDCQLHIEWAVPIPAYDPNCGNSGVILMGNYEIQIFNSFGTDPADMKTPWYADGQAAPFMPKTLRRSTPAARRANGRHTTSSSTSRFGRGAG